jgi:hypothetical protein
MKVKKNQVAQKYRLLWCERTTPVTNSKPTQPTTNNSKLRLNGMVGKERECERE